MKFKLQNGNFSFNCPGCKYTHTVPVDGSRGWKLKADESTGLPTLTPSIKETRGHYVDKQPQPPNCPTCNDKENHEWYNCGCCHLILTEGQIQFCGDSTHSLAGKTVPMLDFSEEA